MGAQRDPGGFRDRWLRRNRMIHLLYRVVVAVVGLAVVALGLVLVPLPGPGWLIVFLGLGILASEFAWAADLLRLGRRRLAAWTAWLSRRSARMRILLGAVTLAGVAGFLAIYARVWGVPGWVPLV